MVSTAVDKEISAVYEGVLSEKREEPVRRIQPTEHSLEARYRATRETHNRVPCPARLPRVRKSSVFMRLPLRIDCRKFAAGRVLKVLPLACNHFSARRERRAIQRPGSMIGFAKFWMRASQHASARSTIVARKSRR